ncbi:anaphase-promoting complex subunit CDC26 [Cotesia typhae]|uniref:anaphase-promoting complex subunit CDC26 n=1 Tax=Cotesia typhae TaxID=2053667 RepID=UPI003D698332
MMRRSPTRIELRLDDLQEYEVIRKEREAKKATEKPAFNWSDKPSQSDIQERIGYVPQPSAPFISHSRPSN